MPNILDHFRGMMGMQSGQTQQTPTPATTPALAPAPTGAPGAPQVQGAPSVTASTAGTAANGAVPVGAAATATPAPSPLEPFKDLWKNDPIKNADGTDAAAPAAPAPLLDPAKLAEAVKGLDFSKIIGQENLVKIAKGGQEAVEAFSASMNSVAQTVFSQSALASTKLIEKALERQEAKFQQDLPGILRKHGLGENLRTENPVFNNPAVAPLVAALESQLSTKFPNASSAELSKMAKDYMSAIGVTFAPKPEETVAQVAAAKAKSKETDWTTFLAS